MVTVRCERAGKYPRNKDGIDYPPPSTPQYFSHFLSLRSTNNAPTVPNVTVLCHLVWCSQANTHPVPVVGRLEADPATGVDGGRSHGALHQDFFGGQGGGGGGGFDEH